MKPGRSAINARIKVLALAMALGHISAALVSGLQEDSRICFREAERVRIDMVGSPSDTCQRTPHGARGSS